MANSTMSDIQSNMPLNIFISLSDIWMIHWQPVKSLLDGILAKIPIVLSALVLNVYYILLQAAKRTMMKGVLHSVTIQHWNLLQTPFNLLLVLPYMLTYQAFFLLAKLPVIHSARIFFLSQQIKSSLYSNWQ